MKPNVLETVFLLVLSLGRDLQFLARQFLGVKSRSLAMRPLITTFVSFSLHVKEFNNRDFKNSKTKPNAQTPFFIVIICLCFPQQKFYFYREIYV